MAADAAAKPLLAFFTLFILFLFITFAGTNSNFRQISHCDSTKIL
jgi:hypothetical protein